MIDAIRKRRSIRKYKSRRLADNKVRQIIEAGRYAPSSHNSQPWRFIVITDKKEIKRLSHKIKSWFRARILLASAVAPFYKKLRKLIASSKKRIDTDKDLFFYGAPCLVLICAKPGRFADQDCALAAQNMMLEAYSLGIGSCWIGFADVVLNTKKKVMDDLKVPKDMKIMASLVFGYPKKFPGHAYPRSDEAKIINWVK